MVNGISRDDGRTPKREFTSYDFSDYMDKIAPYKAKALNGLLTPAELKQIETIKQELKKEYSDQDLLNSGIIGYMEDLPYLNNVAVGAAREGGLEEEARLLSKQIKMKRAYGNLDPDEEKELTDRIHGIYHKLDPWHCHHIPP